MRLGCGDLGQRKGYAQCGCPAGEQRSAELAFLAPPGTPLPALQQLCPAPLFLTCFLSLFLPTDSSVGALGSTGREQEKF